MPDNCLVRRSPTNFADKSILHWQTSRLEWPCERVVAEVEVAAPREIDAFEWAVERILEAFPDQTPTIQEAAQELVAGDVVPLMETLRSLIDLGAVEVKDSTRALDLPNCRLTPVGRELLVQGRVASLVERHGLHLHFDVMTGEHLVRLPRNIRRKPENPIIPPEHLPPCLTNIGLDKVRILSQQQNEPFQKGESQICGVSVRHEDGQHLWAPVSLAIGIGCNRVLRAKLQNSSSARQAWFDQHGWGILLETQLGSASTGGWANGRSRLRQEPAMFEEWLDRVDHLIPPNSTISAARDLIEGANTEVVLHAGWLDAPEIESRLAQSAQRGVRCYVCGTESSMDQWSERAGQSPGFVAGWGSAEHIRPLALVVDRNQGLQIDRLCLQTPSGQDIAVEVATVVKSQFASSLRTALLSGIDQDLRDQSVRHMFAALALSGDISLWKRGVQLIERQAPGVEQVHTLRQWADWGSYVLQGSGSSDDWYDPAVRAWRTNFGAILENQGDNIPWLDAAVGLIPPTEVLTRLIARVNPSDVTQGTDALERLLSAASLVVGRWPQFDPVHQCSRFAAAVKACMITLDSESLSQNVHASVRTLSESPRYQAESKMWLRVLSSAVPKPHDLPSLLEWLEAQSAFVAQQDGALRRNAEQQLERHQELIRKAAMQGNPLVTQLQAAWTGLGLTLQTFNVIANIRLNPAGTASSPAAKTRTQS